MHPRLFVAALLASALSLPAQGLEWTVNGDFTGTLAPWVMGGGYSVNPGHEVGWDTTGMGASDSFGCQPGGQVTPAPYPANTLEQDLLIIQGLTYEFRCDASAARPNSPGTANADAGTIWVEVDGVEIARFAFGGHTANRQKRAQVVGRFTATSTGTKTLRIFFARTFLTNTTTPRVNIDNVSLKDTSGPTYWVRGNRWLGAAVNHELRGVPNALYATFAALGTYPGGVPVSGVSGLWHLDFATSVTTAVGGLDASGAATLARTIPNDPIFLSVPIYYQAASAIGSQVDLSYPFGIVATQ